MILMSSESKPTRLKAAKLYGFAKRNVEVSAGQKEKKVAHEPEVTEEEDRSVLKERTGRGKREDRRMHEEAKERSMMRPSCRHYHHYLKLC